MKRFARLVTVPLILALSSGYLPPHSVPRELLGPPTGITISRLQPASSVRPGTHQLSLSPGGLRLAAAEVDGRVGLWNTVTGTSLFVVRACVRDTPGVLISADGMRMLTFCSQECCIRLWDANDGTLVKTIQFSCVLDMAWSPDGQWLTFQIRPKRSSIRSVADLYEVPVIVLNLATEEQAANLRSKSGAGLFTPAGQLLTACATRKLCMWEIPSGRLSLSFPEVEQPTAICCGGRKLVWRKWVEVKWIGVSEMSWKIHVLDLDTGLDTKLDVKRGLEPSAIGDDHIAFRTLPAKGRFMMIYSVAQMKFVQKLPPEPESVTVAAFSPDGKVLAAMRSSTIKIWHCC